jgi:uncharacterized membrane protein
MAIAGFVVWLALLAAALLLFFRRPRLSGASFVALGVWSIVLRLTTADVSGANSVLIALGAASPWFIVGFQRLYREPQTS